MIWVFLLGFLLSLVWFVKVFKDYMIAKKIAEHWTKIAKAYQKDDFATINKSVKKLKKLGDNDKLMLLLDVEKFLYGKTVYKDPFKAVEILDEINSIKLPEKYDIEKKAEKMPKNFQERVKKIKKVKKRLKKEKYLKSIKKIAREIWNENEFWEVRHNIRRGGVASAS